MGARCVRDAAERFESDVFDSVRNPLTTYAEAAGTALVSAVKSLSITVSAPDCRSGGAGSIPVGIVKVYAPILCRYSIKASTPVFHAGYAGSIPVTCFH